MFCCAFVAILVVVGVFTATDVAVDNVLVDKEGLNGGFNRLILGFGLF
jgi:hypothetical protein